MTQPMRLFINLVTALLFVLLVFMYFIGYWKADPSVQKLFYFIMIAAVFNVGVEVGKNSRQKS